MSQRPSVEEQLLQRETSGISRLLRNARAAASEPERPETPLDIRRGLLGTRGATRAVLLSGGGGASTGLGATRPQDELSSRSSSVSSTEFTTANRKASFESASDAQTSQNNGLSLDCSNDAIRLQLKLTLEGARRLLVADYGVLEVLLTSTEPRFDDPPLRCRAALVVIRNISRGHALVKKAVEVVFVLCRDQGKAAVVNEERLFDPLVQFVTTKLDSAGVLALGAIRAASECPELRTVLVTLGTLPLLKQVFGELAQPSCANKHCDVALVHAAATLRNLSEAFAHHFPKLDLDLECLNVIQGVRNDEVITGVVCALAKVLFSEDSSKDRLRAAPHTIPLIATLTVKACRNVMNGALLQATRLAFILALLLENHTPSQKALGKKNPEVCSELFGVTRAFLSLSSNTSMKEELMINLLRVASHVLLDERCGTRVSRTGFPSSVVTFVGSLDIAVQTDLTLHALIVLSNCMYYLCVDAAPSEEGLDAADDTEEDQATGFEAQKLDLFERLVPMLLGFVFHEHPEGVVEASRIFGNLTRTSLGRAVCHANKVDEVSVALLQHHDARVVYNSLGALLNFCGDAMWAEVMCSEHPEWPQPDDEGSFPALLQAVCNTWKTTQEIKEVALQVAHNWDVVKPSIQELE